MKLGLILWAGLGLAATLRAETPAAASAAGPDKDGLPGMGIQAFKISGQDVIADTGSLQVPENRTRPGSRLISLPFIRFRAMGGSPREPIFWFNGGPGVSNLDMQPPLALLHHHDFVILEYRGVGKASTLLSSPRIGKAFTTLGQNLNAETGYRIAAEVRKAGNELAATGVDLAGYTIDEVILDIETLRAKLGYPKVNLLSHSYGTRVALIYAAKYPDHVSRSFMGGANPPGRFLWDPSDTDSLLQRYSELWSRDPDCKARERDLHRAMLSVSDSMPKHWMGIPIRKAKVQMSAFMLLYSVKTAPLVLDAFVAASQGDASGLAMLSLAHDLVIPRALNWGDFFSKGGIDYDAAGLKEADAKGKSGILGSPSAFIFAAGSGWPGLVDSSRGRNMDISSPTETLILNGELDISTPTANVVSDLLPALPNGRLEIRSNMGHNDPFFLQRGGMVRMAAVFFDSGKVDKSGFREQPIDLRPFWTLPRVAKATLAAATLIVLGGAFAIIRR